ncbi:hypothetical protein DFH28DRAFT_1132268 [Melampsora americana]|nr:hypothetical protein DFH28DRAFT_1132268 [Melampsora americana]
MASQMASNHRYFESLSTDPSNPSWRCLLCGRKPMANYSRHAASVKHLEEVARFEAHAAAAEQLLPGLEEPSQSTSVEPPEVDFNIPAEEHPESARCETPPRPLSPFTSLQAMELPFKPWSMRAKRKMTVADEAALEADLRSSVPLDCTEWYPFKKKEHVVALLIIGSTRSILSQSQYHRIRAILQICDVRLPEWGALRALSKKLKDNFGLTVSERHSPGGKPLFGLEIQTIVRNELSNPQKWREGFSKDLRVQMIVSHRKHFYIYEPVQLVSTQLVVPVFFFQQNERIMAKCLPAEIYVDDNNPAKVNMLLPAKPAFVSDALIHTDVSDFWKTASEITFPDGTRLLDCCDRYMWQEHGEDLQPLPLANPWRERANGQVIKHVPIVFYSDDTAGNVSKKWNKHMSVFFTLAGLPPVMTNQEYNIHFLATSNCATALELLDKIVDDINDHGSNGFHAYDHLSGTDVLVMVVTLCHLGDSPMHAEISNTTNPANTLTPCRMCDLAVTRMADKKTQDYVCQFIGMNADGTPVHLPKLNWQTTRNRTHEIWAAAHNPHSKTSVESKSRQYGLRDTMLEPFIKSTERFTIFHSLRLLGLLLTTDYVTGFDGHDDTPVETLHVVFSQWPVRTLAIIQYKRAQHSTYSTYDFDTLLPELGRQGFCHHPAIGALCIARIYPGEKEAPLDRALSTHLIYFPARNFRLAQVPFATGRENSCFLPSADRFGPACLYNTQKFECYNGVLRTASVHSNRQAPGRDIANSFNNYQLMRLLLSGNSFYDKDLQARCCAGPKVRELLKTKPELAQAMGIDSKANKGTHISLGRRATVSSEVPDCLRTQHEFVWVELDSITLANSQKVEKEDFVKVCSIWHPEGEVPSQALLLVQRTSKGPINPFYGMRELIRLEEHRCAKAVKVDCLLNVQHNCHNSQCPVTNSRRKRVERRDTSTYSSHVAHVANEKFILNSASHYSAETHRAVANLGTRTITPAEWTAAVEEGLRVWRSVPIKPRKPRKGNDLNKGKEKSIVEENDEIDDSDWEDGELELDD